jgi:hypothetical protein
VFVVFLLLIALIAATPVIAFVDGATIHGLVVAIMAAAVAVMARAIPPDEAGHLSKLFRPLAICLALPALWMVIQVLPMPPGGLLSHPIWASAETALGKPLKGSISVDPGVTLIALARYLSVAATIFVAAAVTIDRRRAEWALFSLTGVTAVMAAVVVAHSLVGLSVAEDSYDSGARAILVGGCSLGVIVAAAAAIRAFERHETRRVKGEGSLVKFALGFGASLAALAICCLGLFCGAAPQEIFVAACGFGVMALVVVARRLGLGAFVSATLATFAIIIALVLAAARPLGHGDLTLGYANATPPLISIAERVMSDTAWTGSGAGSFAALLPIYRDVGDLAVGRSAPTSAAQVAIELGAPALWIILIMILAFAGFLLRGAVQRGRDSFYSAAAMSSAVVLTLQAFCNASALGTAIALVAAAILGLGLAQSVSRSTSPRPAQRLG